MTRSVSTTALALLLAGAPTAGADLDRLLHRYFETRGHDERARLAEQIDAAAEGDVARVADALANLQLWHAHPGELGQFSIPSPSGPKELATYQLPDGYHAEKAYPVLVVVPDTWYGSAQAIYEAFALLGPIASRSILICPSWKSAGSFVESGQNAQHLGLVLRHARKRFHTDTNRVYLFGTGEGADAAWMIALTNPDFFAGAILVSGYPKLPYPEAAYPFMLGNLGQLPILSVWSGPGDSKPGDRQHDVAAHNRRIARIASRDSLPINGMEVQAQPAVPPAGAIDAIFARTRPKAPRDLSIWFRYPEQGRIGWLEQTSFKEGVWEEDQLSIVPASGVDRRAFIADVMQSKLAHISARASDRQIDIKTRNCSGLVLRFPPEMIEGDHAITVTINGRRRHAGRIEPSVTTMLEEAYKTWDFGRPVAAERTFTIRRDAEPD